MGASQCGPEQGDNNAAMASNVIGSFQTDWAELMHVFYLVHNEHVSLHCIALQRQQPRGHG